MIDLSSNAMIPTNVDQDSRKPAQSRNTTRRTGQPRAAWLYLCGLRSIDPQSRENARRSFAAVVRPAGNFVVRQLKVSRGNSRTNRWNGRRRPSGASRCATSYVCMAERTRGYVYRCVYAQPASTEVFLRMGMSARAHIHTTQWEQIDANTERGNVCVSYSCSRVNNIAGGVTQTAPFQQDSRRCHQGQPLPCRKAEK